MSFLSRDLDRSAIAHICPFNRRSFLRIMAAAGIALRPHASGSQAQAGGPRFSYPVGVAHHQPGDGLFIRHGYACENTWYNPGWWHTGEDWYLREGESGGTPVLAAAEGEVVYAGGEYPGRVAIVAHGDGLYSMYGHLDYALAVGEGQTVGRVSRWGRSWRGRMGGRRAICTSRCARF